MNVGELFVTLGVKGTEKTVGAITSVKQGLEQTKNMSLEAKAAIVGAMYALERLFSSSGAVGTGLMNFTALTGDSTKQLQQWQYALRQAGGTSQEMMQSVMGLQKAMAAVDLGKGVPEGLTLIAQAAGGIDFSKKDDPFYMLAAINKAVKNLGSSPRAKAIESYLTSSLGVSPNILAGMQRGVFNDKTFAQAPTYSDAQIKSLDKSNIAWSNLGNRIEMQVGRFNAKHGQALVGDLTKLADSVFRLADAMTILAEKLKVFQALQHFVDFLVGMTKTVSVGVDDATGKHKSGDNSKLFGKDSIFGKMLDLRDATDDTLFDVWKKMAPSGANTREQKQIDDMLNSIKPIWDKSYRESSPQKIEIKQDLHFQHDGKDHAQTGDSVKKAAQYAFRQFNQGQVV